MCLHTERAADLYSNSLNYFDVRFSEYGLHRNAEQGISMHASPYYAAWRCPYTSPCKKYRQNNKA